MTMIVEPTMHRKQPNFPNKFSLSFKNLLDIIAARITESAPSGVTNEAGANAYAAKLNASPTPTKIEMKF